MNNWYMLSGKYIINDEMNQRWNNVCYRQTAKQIAQ